MNTLIVQGLRTKLKQRLERFDNADEPDTLHFKLRQFWGFFNSHSMYVGIVEALLPQFPSVDADIDKVFRGESVRPTTEEQAAALGYRVLQRLVDEGQQSIHQLDFSASAVLHRPPGGEESFSAQGFLEFYLHPLCYYVDENLDTQGAMLSLLMRYKHRSEWFYRKKLWKKCQERDDSEKRNKIEKRLAVDLYAYLYDQGIDFHIEPSSMPGAIDLIAAQDTDDPLPLDAKVFDNANRNKYYLCKGFNQIYTYTQQYNEPAGYLLIYNISGKELSFSLQCSGHIPMIMHNNKTIFLITLDISPDPKPPSTRGYLKPIVIAENDLIRSPEAK